MQIDVRLKSNSSSKMPTLIFFMSRKDDISTEYFICEQLWFASKCVRHVSQLHTSLSQQKEQAGSRLIYNYN
jgi:hypothetical protein